MLNWFFRYVIRTFPTKQPFLIALITKLFLKDIFIFTKTKRTFFFAGKKICIFFVRDQQMVSVMTQFFRLSICLPVPPIWAGSYTVKGSSSNYHSAQQRHGSSMRTTSWQLQRLSDLVVFLIHRPLWRDDTAGQAEPRMATSFLDCDI